MSERLLKIAKKLVSYRRDLPGLQDPIVPDGIKILKKNEDAIKFTNRAKFMTAWGKEKFFSASESWSYQSAEDQKAGKKDEQSVIWHETGRQLVAVWDDKQKLGYIVPSWQGLG